MLKRCTRQHFLGSGCKYNVISAASNTGEWWHVASLHLSDIIWVLHITKDNTNNTNTTILVIFFLQYFKDLGLGTTSRRRQNEFKANNQVQKKNFKTMLALRRNTAQQPMWQSHLLLYPAAVTRSDLMRRVWPLANLPAAANAVWWPWPLRNQPRAHPCTRSALRTRPTLYCFGATQILEIQQTLERRRWWGQGRRATAGPGWVSQRRPKSLNITWHHDLVLWLVYNYISTQTSNENM